MHTLRYTLLADGSSDRILLNPINWLLEDLLPNHIIRGEMADFTFVKNPPPIGNLLERIRLAFQLFPCDLLFIHRDAERSSWEDRASEIQSAIDDLLALDIKFLKVIPIRMTEAWLLIDEAAIRAAAGNRNSNIPLNLPPIQRLESISDPKSELIQILKTAGELSGRKLEQFNARAAIHRVAENIPDFSPLLRLSAFQRLESEVRDMISYL